MSIKGLVTVVAGGGGDVLAVEIRMMAVMVVVMVELLVMVA